MLRLEAWLVLWAYFGYFMPQTFEYEFCCHLQVKKGDKGQNVVKSSWNVMVHSGAHEGKWRGDWWIEWVASTLHTTWEHGTSSIATADAQTSAVSSRLNWRPRRFKWSRPFRWKTKSGFCACAITFRTQSKPVWSSYIPSLDDSVVETNWYKISKTVNMTGLGTLFLGSQIIHKSYSVWNTNNSIWEYYIAMEFGSKIEWNIAWIVLGLNNKDASCDIRKTNECLTLSTCLLSEQTSDTEKKKCALCRRRIVGVFVKVLAMNSTFVQITGVILRLNPILTLQVNLFCSLRQLYFDSILSYLQQVTYFKRTRRLLQFSLTKSARFSRT